MFKDRSIKLHIQLNFRLKMFPRKILHQSKKDSELEREKNFKSIKTSLKTHIKIAAIQVWRKTMKYRISTQKRYFKSLG